MKCPKCGYLGFETTDQCRNCGYDFSLAVRSDTPTELPLRSSDTPESPLADFEFGDRDVAHETSATTLDLDRVIGAPPSAPDRPRFTRGRARVAVATPPGAGAAGATRAAESTGAADASGTSGPHTASELPLFGAGPTEIDDTPLITSPRPVRPPLSVRRATPDIVRGRPRSSRAPLPRDESSELALQLDGPPAVAESASRLHTAPVAAAPARVAGAFARLVAMLIDLSVLSAINAAVLYLTLGIAGLTVDDISRVPPIPFVAFLVILNGGYLIGFTAASGQTIGKMATSIRVVGIDGQRVDVPGAALRAGGCLLTLLTAGLGYLPALFSSEGRAVQDRVAGTRVISTR